MRCDLSRQQQAIVRMAHRYRETKGRKDDPFDIGTWEVLSDYYGWQQKKGGKRGYGLRYSYKIKDFVPDLWFRREHIGRTKYNRVMASLCRSKRRLADRGLVKLVLIESGDRQGWSSIKLTDEGQNVARTLQLELGDELFPDGCPATWTVDA